MKILTLGTAVATVLALATPALAQRSGGGNSDAGNGLVRDLHAGNDRTGGVRSGAGRTTPEGFYRNGYYGAYYGTRDPGPYYVERGRPGYPFYP